MPREIKRHKFSGLSDLNDQITIMVQDDPGHGGASHVYDVQLPYHNLCTIHFQDGPIQEAGVNGLSNEVLLAIVEDRLLAFQQGPYACDENADALSSVCYALDSLHSRTADRLTRGVEGTSEK